LATLDKQGPDIIGHALPEDAECEADDNQRLARVGDLLPPGFVFNLDAECEAVDRHTRAGAFEWLEAGRHLLIIREHVPHGSFLAVLTDRLGYSPRGAQKLMYAAVRYFGRTLDPNKVKALSNLSQSKMLELLVLDDEDLQGLADGKSVADLSLDKIDRMSVRELRKEIRKSLDQYEHAQKKVQEKNDRIEKLDDEIRSLKRQWKVAPPDEKRREIEQAIRDQELMVKGQLMALRKCVHELAKLAHDDDARELVGHVMARLLVAVQVVRDDEELPMAIPIVRINDGAHVEDDHL
jgi:hypothetical protein